MGDYLTNQVRERDVVDQKLIRRFMLRNGNSIPGIGFGTYPHGVTHEESANAVYNAIKLGYRLIDCAANYGNEKEIGLAIEFAIKEGVPREDLFITSKLKSTKLSQGEVFPALEQTLRDLRLDYLDGYYIHWPFPNLHLSELTTERSPDARPYIHEEYIVIWRELEKAYDQKLIRSLGTSNMTMKKYKRFLEDVRIAPSFEQLELHPCFSQVEYVNYLKLNSILPVAYSPIGAPNRVEKTGNEVCDIEQPEIVEIADNHGVHPATICLKWAIQRDTLPLAFSGKYRNYCDNLKGITEDMLSDEEMNIMNGLECNSRINKGIGFLWESAKDWHDIWDE